MYNVCVVCVSRFLTVGCGYLGCGRQVTFGINVENLTPNLNPKQVTFGINMEDGVEVDRTKEKDEIALIGNSLEAVGT
jgi:hypothetical protein